MINVIIYDCNNKLKIKIIKGLFKVKEKIIDNSS